MAIAKDFSGEIRNFIVTEIQNRLGPLVEKVDKQGNVLRSLYANGSGGPPGYLEMARAEDKRTQDQLFKKIDKVGERLDMVEGFITKHEARETQREQDRISEAAKLAETVKASDRRFKKYIALWSLALAAFMALVAIYDHWPAVRRSLLDEPTGRSTIHVPQDAGLPSSYAPR